MCSGLRELSMANHAVEQHQTKRSKILMITVWGSGSCHIYIFLKLARRSFLPISSRDTKRKIYKTVEDRSIDDVCDMYARFGRASPYHSA
jgi:hypothetical protein